MDPFDIFMDEPEHGSGACGECPRHEGCNDIFKNTYACRELYKKEKKDAGNKRQS